MVKVAINGFGRIGRNYLRAVKKRGEDIQIVAINDLSPIATAAHLAKYDSILGPYECSIEVQDETTLLVDGEPVKYYQERNPEDLPWRELGIEVVIEATGIFTKKADAEKHKKAGARNVIITGPSSDAETIVLGVNDDVLAGEHTNIVSNASCTTNCLAPLIHILHNEFGVTSGSMVTVHAYTNDQNLMDSPHKDLRRARAGATNIIPTSTGAAKAVAKVIPSLEGLLSGYAVRVPVQTGSMVSFTFTLAKNVTIEAINTAIKNSAGNFGSDAIIAYTEDPIVSSDIVGSSHSSIFDASLTSVQAAKDDETSKLYTIVSWYDNEVGYTNRLVDLTSKF